MTNTLTADQIAFLRTLIFSRGLVHIQVSGDRTESWMVPNFPTDESRMHSTTYNHLAMLARDAGPVTNPPAVIERTVNGDAIMPAPHHMSCSLSERKSFVLEDAEQMGFHCHGDEADVYVCTADQLLDFAEKTHRLAVDRPAYFDHVVQDRNAPRAAQYLTYGHNFTVHQTEHLNIEMDPVTHHPVAVWFRCMALPFDVSIGDESRVNDMRLMYEGKDIHPIKAVVMDMHTSVKK